MKFERKIKKLQSNKNALDQIKMGERRGQGTIFCFVFLPVFVFFVSLLFVCAYVSFMQAKRRLANGVGLSALSCISGTFVYFHIYLPFLVHIYGTSRTPGAANAKATLMQENRRK